jgi:ParB family chromosome partitioning protein
MGRRKGKIVVEFATIDDLERIVEAMSPGSAPASQTVSRETTDTD